MNEDIPSLRKIVLFTFIGGVILGGIISPIGTNSALNRVLGAVSRVSSAETQFSFSWVPTSWLREIVEKREAEDELEATLDSLMMCESGGRPDISIIDTNGKRSSGHFMFQDSTWIELAKRYGIVPAAEDHELLNLILDPVLQRQVAKQAIKDGEGWRWKKCLGI